MSETTTKKTVNIFALIGFVILFALAIWSTIQVVKFVPRMFGGDSLHMPHFSLFSFTEGIHLSTLPKSAVSGTPVTLQWTLKTKKEGVLSFAYACQRGFHFRLPAVSQGVQKGKVQVDASNYTVLPCNMPYTLPEKASSLTVIPVLDGQESKKIKFAIAFTDADKKVLRDLGEFTVRPATATASSTQSHTENDDAGSVMGALKDFATASTTNASTTAVRDNPDLFPHKDAKNEAKTSASSRGNGVVTQTSISAKKTRTPVRYVTVPLKPASDPNGVANLSVHILSVGVIDPRTGAFVPKGTIAPYERAAVRFQVKNTGTKMTGQWNYRADLPTNPHYYYASKWQPNLMPGATATVTVTFDQLELGRVSVRIHADPYGYIPESNETDNIDSRVFTVVNYPQY